MAALGSARPTPMSTGSSANFAPLARRGDHRVTGGGAVTGGAIRLHAAGEVVRRGPAVTGIDLEIPAGQFYLAARARPGCGKTTTLRMIAGFEKPDSGRIELDGRDVARRSAAQAPGQHRLPDLRAVPVHVGVGQRRLRAALPEGVQARRPSAGSARHSSWCGWATFAKRKPAPALRRPAAARRAGPGTGAAAAGAAARRAARRAGRQAAQAAAAANCGRCSARSGSRSST